MRRFIGKLVDLLALAVATMSLGLGAAIVAFLVGEILIGIILLAFATTITVLAFVVPDDPYRHR